MTEEYQNEHPFSKRTQYEKEAYQHRDEKEAWPPKRREKQYDEEYYSDSYSRNEEEYDDGYDSNYDSYEDQYDEEYDSDPCDYGRPSFGHGPGPNRSRHGYHPCGHGHNNQSHHGYHPCVHQMPSPLPYQMSPMPSHPYQMSSHHPPYQMPPMPLHPYQMGFPSFPPSYGYLYLPYYPSPSWGPPCSCSNRSSPYRPSSNEEESYEEEEMEEGDY